VTDSIYSGNGRHELRIIPVGEAFMTCRTTYRVECLTCKALVHPATTGPLERARDHMEGRSVDWCRLPEAPRD
jgi:hypothetical protein